MVFSGGWIVGWNIYMYMYKFEFRKFILGVFLIVLSGVCWKGFIYRLIFDNFLLVLSFFVDFVFKEFFFREFLREFFLRLFFLRLFFKDFLFKEFFFRGFVLRVVLLRVFLVEFVLRELLSDRLGDEFRRGVKEFLFLSGVRLGLRDLEDRI